MTKTPKTVLYIEDDADTRNVYTDFLKRRVDEVITADNGEEGLQKFIDHQPDLIITDVKMPDKNGIELVKAIRNIDKKIPIIVFSAYTEEEFIKDSVTNRVNALISKPADIHEFSQVINQYLNKNYKNSDDSDAKTSSEHSAQINMGKTPKELIVVGIGASAGGLEALSALVESLPLQNKSAYIVAQHLSPDHKTMLVNLLSRETDLKIKDAENGEKLEEDVIYITPPNKNIEIDRDEHIILSTPDPHSFLPKPSVNQLFISIAENKKELGIGVILSGTGSDGTQGMRAINAEGGITIVQVPGSAKYDGMPLSAINGSTIDIITEPAQIGQELVSLANFPREKVLKKYQSSIESDELTTIYDMLYKYKKVDFSVYKKTTIGRRIERRMVALKSTTMSDYVDILQNDPNEVAALFKDILIGVTSFFRDPEAFDSLKKTISKYLDENPDMEEFRVWVTGCSTGEEAYSILMMVKELIDTKHLSIHVKVFATDIDEDALKIARAGRYSHAAMTNMDPEFIKKYFTLRDTEFEAKKFLRESIVFSYHNLLYDPPFKNIDISVCRNLLIYLNHEAQQYVMPVLHYSLNNNGILFLGKSENVTNFEHLFVTMDKRNKIFKRIPSVKKELNLASPKQPYYKRPEIKHTSVSESKRSIHETVVNEASKILLPNVLITNEQMEVIYKKGNLSFVSVPDGHVSFNIFKIVDPRLSIDLRSCANAAKQSDEVSATVFIPIQNQDNEFRFVKAFVVPLLDKREPMFLFYFLEIEPKDIPNFPDNESGSDHSANQLLELELARTKEHMQTLIEELETTNEELQSTNEELQSSNEELQSTNEELETSNEELQSTNEELQTTYVELKEMYQNNTAIKDKLAALNGRYESLLENISDAVVVSNLDNVILKVNKAMEYISEYSKDQLMTKTWEDLFLSEEPHFNEYEKKSLLQDGKLDSFMSSIKTKSGKIKLLSIESYILSGDGDQHQIWSFATDLTELSQSQSELALSEKTYKLTFDEANIGIAHVGLDGRWISVNKKICDFLGYTKEELQAKTFQDITHPEDLNRDLDLLEKVLAGELDNYKIEKRYFTKKGDTVWALLSVALVRNEDGSPKFFISIVEDITELKELNLQKDQAQVVFDATQEGIMVTAPDTTILSVNPSFEHITGFSSKEVIGKRASLLQSHKHSQDFYKEMWRTIQHTGFWSGEIINRHKNGELYPVYLNVNAVKDHDENIIQFIGVLTDISQLKQSQEKVHYLANHDTLTDLPNRTLFMDRLEHALDLARRNDSTIALLFIDLDRFKIINDGLGHQAGDTVLVEVAQRLKRGLREQDSVARLGGDEFVVIVENMVSPIEAGRVAETILDLMAQPIAIGESSVQVGCSIGISVFPNDGNTPDELLRQADIAMYEAKDSGKNTYRFTTDELSSDAFEKATMEHTIREGLINGEFQVFYQPILDIHTNQIKHLEALIRWYHPKLGVVLPGKFIPLAEESDLINSITDFVIYEVVRDINTIRNKYQSNCKVTINFSVKDFENEKLYYNLKNHLQKRSMDGDSIILELTERKFLLDSSLSRENFKQYENLNCGISLDDFGTGFSNLSYLSDIPLNYLKIDRSFVARIGEKKSEEIIKATIAIASALKVKVIGEGIETEEQLKFLKDNNCDYGQGFLLCPPIPIIELYEFFEDHGFVE